jgi:hypothetical protein
LATPPPVREFEILIAPDLIWSTVGEQQEQPTLCSRALLSKNGILCDVDAY